MNKMKKCLVILAKTPFLSDVKTRLSSKIGIKNTHIFYEMCKNCLEDLTSKLDYDIKIATAEKEGESNDYWKKFNTFFAEGKNIAEKQNFIFQELLKIYESVILIGIDIPQLSKKFINNAFKYLEKNNQIIGPSTDGGFYLIGSKSNIKKEVWENTEWSCAKTLQTFVCSLKPKPYKLKIFTDVDEFQDLSEMIKEMPSITSKRQVKLIKWVNSIEELIK